MRVSRLVGVGAITLLSAACLVDVQEVADPGPAFAEARRDAARVAGRPGPPDSLEVLVYDRDDGQLVRASVPMGIVERFDDGTIDVDFDDEEIDLGLDEETAESVRRHLRLSELKQAPLGPVVEVEEEDGDQVLVWLR
jgi:hypothetical protein